MFLFYDLVLPDQIGTVLYVLSSVRREPRMRCPREPLALASYSFSLSLSTQNKWDHYPRFATCSPRVLVLNMFRDYTSVSSHYCYWLQWSFWCLVIFTVIDLRRKLVSKIICAQSGIIPTTRLPVVETGHGRYWYLSFPGQVHLVVTYFRPRSSPSVLLHSTASMERCSSRSLSVVCALDHWNHMAFNASNCQRVLTRIGAALSHSFLRLDTFLQGMTTTW